MANRNPHDSNELLESPIFEIGQKVRSLQNVRNDGTYPGPAVGDVLIPAGAIGYVISVGSYLQMYHIYSVDFFEQRRVIGMHEKELEMIDATPTRLKPLPPPNLAERSHDRSEDRRHCCFGHRCSG
jgi:nitrogen fixation protein NifZ